MLVFRKPAVAVLLALAFPLLTASALPVYPIDSKELFITSHQDPNFPIPRIGDRSLAIEFSPPPSWSQIAVKLRVSPDPDALENGSHTTVDAVFTSPSPGTAAASAILPWSPPKPSALVDKPADIAPPGSEVFYRWEIRYTEGGKPFTRIGDRHAFTMPRRVILAILGDSFGSGEGAPSLVGNPWQPFNEGTEAHRSPISGQELAVKNFFATRPEIAYDYLNVSSSGAIASDIYSTVSQKQRTGGEGISFVQSRRLDEWLTARDYSSLDAIILSCGGNDVGFSTVLQNYLGLDTEKLKSIALNTLSDSDCIARAVATFVVLGGPLNPGSIVPAAGVWVSCVAPRVILNVYNAIQKDYSFKTPYNAANLTNNQYWPFSDYVDRLRGEYTRLQLNLNYGLDNAGRQVRPDQVLVTEYPGPLKDCVSFHETPPLVSLKADTPILDIGVNSIPGLSFIKDGPSIRIDLTHIRGLRVGFSAAETTEITTELAPDISKPRPALGGLSHIIKEIVDDVEASTPDITWTFVRTSDFQPPMTGVAFTGAHFNTLTTAQDQVGPNIINNAYHPNQLGHEFTYQPAILDSLFQRLTPARFEQRAADEGLTRPADPLPDLAFEIGTPTVSFTPGSGVGRLVVDFEVVNRGSISVAAGTPVAIDLFARQDLKLAEEFLPLLDINESHRIRREFDIPLASILTVASFDCAGAPYPGFDAFATRDAVLRYFFSDDKGEVRITIDPANTVAESNKPNNRSKHLIDIPADDSAPGFRDAINGVLADISFLLRRPITAITLELLLREQQVRDYFRHYSPELDLEGKSLEQAVTDNEAYRREICVAQALGISPPPPKPEPMVMGELRPICLIPPATGRCGTAADALVRDGLGQLSEIQELVRNAPRDGRSLIMEAILSEQFAAILGRPTLPIEFTLPVTAGGLKNPPDGLPLDLGGTRFILQHLPGVEHYALTLGTQPGTADLLSPTPLDPKNNSIDVSELPKDGRTVHATITTYTESGPEKSLYQFPTPRLNAALVAPNANQRLNTEGVQLKWDHPDPAIAGPVESYSVAVGSYPGTSDVFPGIDGGPARRNSVPAIQFRTVPATENSFVLNQLPRDGRRLYITLGTLRDGVWEYETHARFAAMTTHPGIRIPRPDRPILAREHFYLAPGSTPAESFQLLLGSTPGSNDLFSSGQIPATAIDQPIDVQFESFKPAIDDDGRPFPIWATVISEGDIRRTESYGLIPSLDASFIDPFPADRLPANASVIFTWSAGFEAEGYRLTVYSGQNGDKPLYQETMPPDRLSAEVPLELTRDPAIVVVIETLRERHERLSTGANGSIYVINQDDFRYYVDDAIDDAWQIRYFGPNNPNGLARADADGDGRDNAAEFLQGTDPTRADTPRAPSVVRDETSGRPTAFVVQGPLSWTRYQLEQSTNLGDDWRAVSDPVAPSETGGSLLIPIPESSEPTIFHRLRLSPSGR